MGKCLLQYQEWPLGENSGAVSSSVNTSMAVTWQKSWYVSVNTKDTPSPVTSTASIRPFKDHCYHLGHVSI